MTTLQQALAARLAEREAASLYRRRRTLNSPQQPRVIVDQRPLLSFCSNDYLGLAAHPEVIASFQQAAARSGGGRGAGGRKVSRRAR